MDFQPSTLFHEPCNGQHERTPLRSAERIEIANQNPVLAINNADKYEYFSAKRSGGSDHVLRYPAD
jgi:hypothetical protein